MSYKYLLEFTGQNLGSSPLWPIYLPPCPLAWTLQTQNKLSNKKSPVHETNPEPPGMHTNRTKSSSNILDCCRMCLDFPGFSYHPRNPSCSVALLALHAPPWLMAASTNLRALSSQNASCVKRTLVARSRSCPQGEWLWLTHPEGMPQIHANGNAPKIYGAICD